MLLLLLSRFEDDDEEAADEEEEAETEEAGDDDDDEDAEDAADAAEEDWEESANEVPRDSISSGASSFPSRIVNHLLYSLSSTTATRSPQHGHSNRGSTMHRFPFKWAAFTKPAVVTQSPGCRWQISPCGRPERINPRATSMSIAFPGLQRWSSNWRACQIGNLERTVIGCAGRTPCAGGKFTNFILLENSLTRNYSCNFSKSIIRSCSPDIE